MVFLLFLIFNPKFKIMKKLSAMKYYFNFKGGGSGDPPPPPPPPPDEEPK